MNGTTRGAGSWWKWVIPLLTVLGAAGVPILGLYGWRAVLNSTDGSLTEVITDPEAPGYEVVVEPTPTMLVLATDQAGALIAATVLTLSVEQAGGSVVVIPVEVAPAGRTLAEIHAAEGPDATQSAVESILTAAVASRFETGPGGWQNMLEAVAPIPVPLSDTLVQPDGAGGTPTVVFSAGTVALAPSQVAEFLASRNPGETPLNRAQRQLDFWEAWLGAVSGTSDPAALPGEADVGIGRFVRVLSDGNVRYSLLPVLPLPGAVDMFALDAEQVTALVASAIPFPQGTQAQPRARLVVLDGTGNGFASVSAVAQRLAQLGAQPVVLGNADEFDLAQTSVVYHHEDWTTLASTIAAELGGATITLEPVEAGPIDITVIVGADNQSGGN